MEIHGSQDSLHEVPVDSVIGLALIAKQKEGIYVVVVAVVYAVQCEPNEVPCTFVELEASLG